MNRLLMFGLMGALSLPLLTAPGTASASCSDRKATGTVLGGLGGALIGNSIAHGGGGLVLGGLGGAVVGHEIGASGCARAPRTAYYRPAPERPLANTVYYDRFGNPVSETTTSAAVAIPTGYVGSSACHTEMQSYYDARGALVQRPVQVCAR